MGARWLLALPLIVAATALPSCGQLALRAWREDPDASFGHVFAAGFGDHFWALFGVPLAVTAFFLVTQTFFTRWPWASVLIAVWAVVPEIFIDRGSILPNLALGAGLALANYELGRLALRRLTHPVTRGLGPSPLEVPYAIPGLQARLRIQGMCLLLDLDERTQRRDLKDLLNVTFEQLPEPTSWQLPTLTTAGPVLRVITEIDEWLLPVDEADGDALVVIILARARDEMRRLG